MFGNLGKVWIKERFKCVYFHCCFSGPRGLYTGNVSYTEPRQNPKSSGFFLSELIAFDPAPDHVEKEEEEDGAKNLRCWIM